MIYACCLVLLTVAAGDSPPTRFEFTEIQMGMPFKLVLYAANEATANRAAAAAFARIKQLNGVMSDYDADSELSRFCAAAPHPQPVSDDLWRVLTASQRLAERSDGAFDVTVGPLVRQWRRARRKQELPSAENLAAAKALVGYNSLRLDDKRQAASLDKAKMQIDLGGIAAGDACDEALKVLHKHGIRAALIDASGDVLVGDPPPDRKGWRIGLVDPEQPDGASKQFLILANAAVTTSGDVEQHVEIGGRRYSHIVDPKTGLGLTDRSTVIVVARDCITADSFATAVSVLGPKRGLKLIEATDGAAAIIYRHAGEKGKLETFRSERVKELTFEEPAK